RILFALTVLPWLLSLPIGSLHFTGNGEFFELPTRKTVPLFAGTPPVAEALAIQRVALILTDMEQEPYAAYLPPAPAYYMYDASTLEGHLINPLPFI
ncbi:MAG: hypothetical protein ACYCRF_12270, partial [Acidithiobacillus sp.]